MNPPPVLEALARRYERSRAGRTGAGARDLLVSLEDLLAGAGCREGEKRALAEQHLAQAEAAGLLTRVPIHKRDHSEYHQIRFSPSSESALYDRLGRPSPTALREQTAAQFETAANLPVPEQWTAHWREWCRRMAQAALAGASLAPFDREPTHANAELLQLLPKLLAWEGESLVRFASCILCGDSKRLQELTAPDRGDAASGQLRGKLGRLLEDITAGSIRSLDDLGIIPNPRSALVHGPLKLRLQNQWLDLSLLQGPLRLSQLDIERAEAIETSAPRCLTIENETTFHELAKLQSGELLLCTSYPGGGTLALLRRLPPAIDCWHFGDSDPAGFDILRVLRQKSGRGFKPIHMDPSRPAFEQEALGRPTKTSWPFY